MKLWYLGHSNLTAQFFWVPIIFQCAVCFFSILKLLEKNCNILIFLKYWKGCFMHIFTSRLFHLPLDLRVIIAELLFWFIPYNFECLDIFFGLFSCQWAEYRKLDHAHGLCWSCVQCGMVASILDPANHRGRPPDDYRKRLLHYHHQVW